MVSVFTPSERRAAAARSRHSGVPSPSAWFWVLAVLATGMGDVVADSMASHDVVAVAAVTCAVFVVLVIAQVSTRTRRTGLFWLTIVVGTIAATVLVDAAHDLSRLSYLALALALVALITVGFEVWHRAGGIREPGGVHTTAEELTCWGAAFGLLCLGTAVGDLTAYSMTLGHLPSALFFAGLISLPPLAVKLGLISEVGAFWCTFALTRPLGASVADWFSKPVEVGNGLGWGDLPVAGGALFVIAGVVLVAAKRHH